MEPYCRIDFDSDSVEISELTIALLNDYPIESFDESNDGLLSGYLPYYLWSDDLRSEIEKAISPVSRIIQVQKIEGGNWNEEWESKFEPVEIGELARIRAVFHESKEGFKYEVVIHPRMAFGTGHHATTNMMVRLMDTMQFAGKSVFDFGCGTGVLGILASMMGASHVIGNDVEPWAVESSCENAQLNNVTNIEFSEQTITDYVSAGLKVDIVLANIQLDVLSHYGNDIKELLGNEGGYVLLSGVLGTFRKDIEKCYEALGFTLKTHLEKDGWICQLYYIEYHSVKFK